MVKSIFILEKLISGMFPFVLIVATGIYFTVRTGGYQFKNFGKSLRAFFAKNESKKGGITPFSAACNSLSATVGTGNIIGVSAAIGLGGAGAVFWMWVSAVFAMCIKSAEIVAAVKFKQHKNGENYGGPMYYIKSGILAKIYAVCGVFACVFGGNIIQTNSAVIFLGSNLKIAVGIIFTVITALVVIGGTQKISKFTLKAVPLMSVLYITLCLGVILSNISQIPNCFANIFKGAFNPAAVSGGAVGSVLVTVISGASKGVFSNEAGLGTAGMAYALTAGGGDAETKGLYGIFEVFLDTIVLCTLTALTILCSGGIIDYGNPKTVLIKEAFYSVYGNFSVNLLSFMLLLFGISSIIGWAVYGINCGEFLFKKNGKKIFTVLYPVFCIIGAVLNVNTVWRLAEFFNGIMVIINLYGLLNLADCIIPLLKGNKNDRKKN